MISDFLLVDDEDCSVQSSSCDLVEIFIHSTSASDSEANSDQTHLKKFNSNNNILQRYNNTLFSSFGADNVASEDFVCSLTAVKISIVRCAL